MNEDYLYHFGVKGMKWGVRKDKSSSGASFSTKRKAKKDAKEFARAKMFYGEGAGTRRKLIKNKVEQRKKTRPGYSKEFEKHLANQKWDKHADAARRERTRKNITKSTAKTARGLVHKILGTGGTVSASALAAYQLYKIGNQTGVNAKIADAMKGQYKSAKIYAKAAKNVWKNRKK